ncbi:hypothetical protein NDU88_004574 [Pleurodeles waltl]|uniref:Uncharacterized protein n=1 Tax=Pleurodeles waltl TaxID=8319 RepID=A0AAV7QI92_PLEWA|nr:hypothetical protein NDU88_004574 [Pleurodeles waltl]
MESSGDTGRAIAGVPTQQGGYTELSNGLMYSARFLIAPLSCESISSTSAAVSTFSAIQRRVNPRPRVRALGPAHTVLDLGGGRGATLRPNKEPSAIPSGKHRSGDQSKEPAPVCRVYLSARVEYAPGCPAGVWPGRGAALAAHLIGDSPRRRSSHPRASPRCQARKALRGDRGGPGRSCDATAQCTVQSGKPRSPRHRPHRRLSVPASPDQALCPRASKSSVTFPAGKGDLYMHRSPA